MHMRIALIWLLTGLAGAVQTKEPDPAPARANTWVNLDRAAIPGQRWDVPLGYSPELKRFIVLGGRTSWGEYKKPRPYDVLTLYPKSLEWENSFPEGKEWG